MMITMSNITLKNYPITDNHIHVDNVNGYGAEKVSKIFKNAGGKVMILLNKPDFTGDLIKSIDRTVRDVEYINKNIDGIECFGLVGVHPSELTEMLKRGMSLEEGKNRIIKALDYCKKIVLENDYIVGIGEVGRPHYTTTEEVWKVSNEILKYAMEICSDINCAIQIHSESPSEEQFKELSELAKSVNLKPEKVIKHHCGDMVLEGERYGIFPSIVATGVVSEACKKSLRFVMETDYIDDLRRPGVVLGIKTVPRRTLKLLNSGLIDEEGVYKIHKENIEKLYDISISF